MLFHHVTNSLSSWTALVRRVLMIGSEMLPTAIGQEEVIEDKDETGHNHTLKETNVMLNRRESSICKLTQHLP